MAGERNALTRVVRKLLAVELCIVQATAEVSVASSKAVVVLQLARCSCAEPMEVVHLGGKSLERSQSGIDIILLAPSKTFFIESVKEQLYCNIT